MKLKNFDYDYICSNKADENFRIRIPEGITDTDGISGIYPAIENIKEIILPESLKNISSDFSNMVSSVTDLKLPSNLEKISEKAFLNSKIENIEFNEGLTEIGEKAFYDSNVKKIILPSSVKKVGPSAFEGCRNLTEIFIPNTVEDFDFTALSGIPLDAIKMEEGNRLFEFVEEDALTYLVSKITGEKLICYGDKNGELHLAKNFFLPLHNGCENRSFLSGLKKLYLPANYNTFRLLDANLGQELTTEDDAEELMLIRLRARTIRPGKNVKEINTYEAVLGYGKYAKRFSIKLYLNQALEKIGKNVFQHFQILNDIEFPPSLKKIEEEAFYEYHCKNLILNEGLVDIGSGAFKEGSAETVYFPSTLKKLSGFEGFNFGKQEIKIPEGVEILEEYAFSNAFCESIKLPSTLKKTCNESLYGYEIKKIDSDDCRNLEYLAGFRNFKNKITVPSSVKILGERAFYGGFDIEEVVLPEGLEAIELQALSGCPNLKKINLPECLKKLSSGALSYCRNLDFVRIPSSVKKIEAGCFEESLLNSVEICNGVEEIDNSAFFRTKLKSVIIPDSIKTIGNDAFRDCENLETIVIGMGVKTIGYKCFADCKNLKEVIVKNPDTYISDDAFLECDNLMEIRSADSDWTFEILNKENDGGITPEQALEELKSKDLRFVEIEWSVLTPKKSEKIIVNKKRSLSRDSALKLAEEAVLNKSYTVKIPESYLEIEAKAFSDCKEIKKVILPESIAMIQSEAFSNCTALEEINWPENLTFIRKGAFFNTKLKYADFSNVINLEIPFNLEEEDRSAYDNIPESLEILKLGKASDEFRFLKTMKGLKEIYLSENTAFFETNSNADISRLEKIICPLENPYFEASGNTVRIKSTQELAVSLEKNITLTEYEFFKSFSKKTIYPALETLIITNNGSRFSLKHMRGNPFETAREVVFKNDVEYLNLYGFRNIQKITIPQNCKILGKECFEGSQLKSIRIPASVERIEESCFTYCNELEEVVLEEGLKYIEKHAFSFCLKLKAIVIPSTVESIAEDAFMYCYELNTVIYKGNKLSSEEIKKITQGTKSEKQKEDPKEPGYITQEEINNLLGLEIENVSDPVELKLRQINFSTTKAVLEKILKDYTQVKSNFNQEYEQIKNTDGQIIIHFNMDNNSAARIILPVDQCMEWKNTLPDLLDTLNLCRNAQYNRRNLTEYAQNRDINLIFLDKTEVIKNNS